MKRLLAEDVQAAGLAALWWTTMSHVAFYLDDIDVQARNVETTWKVPNALNIHASSSFAEPMMLFRSSGDNDDCGTAILEARPPCIMDDAQDIGSCSWPANRFHQHDAYALVFNPSEILSPPVRVLPMVLDLSFVRRRAPGRPIDIGWRIYNGVLIGLLVRQLLHTDDFQLVGPVRQEMHARC